MSLQARMEFGRKAVGATLLAGAVLLALTLGAAPAAARKGDARAGLFVGTMTFNLEGYNTFGTSFGGSYGYEFEDDLEWSIGGRFSAANGEADLPPVTQFSANTAAFQTGITAYFNREPSSLIVPFVGGGLSFLNYDLVFPGTTVGTTSGTGPGAFTQAGIEVRLTRNLTLIPQFGIQVHTIKTESGASVGLLSGGLVFTVRISG